MDIQVGTITHYYDKIAVAVVEVKNQPLKVGDRVRISGHDKEFKQSISSLQIEHKQVSEVPAGETAGMKLEQAVKEGDRLFLVTK